MKVGILGTGSWGTALAQVLADNGHEVCMYGIQQSQVDDINLNHQNSVFFETKIHEAIRATTSLKDTLNDSEMILLAVPSGAIDSVLQQVNANLDHRVIVINVAKGFHPITHEFLSQVIERTMDGSKRIATVDLIGPSHAEEVILRLLTAVNAVSSQESAAIAVQNAFSNSYFRVYTNNDVIGAETGVAVKNIMAIASGVLEGVGQGDNARAALMTRGLAEMSRYGVALGGKKETYLGLDGVGDLIVTCTSRHSRNFMAGLEIAKVKKASIFLANNKKTVEGIAACKIVHEEAQKLSISMPITDQVYAVLFEDKDPELAIQELMMRDLKAERI